MYVYMYVLFAAIPAVASAGYPLSRRLWLISIDIGMTDHHAQQRPRTRIYRVRGNEMTQVKLMTLFSDFDG